MIPRKKLVPPTTHVRDARLYIIVVEGERTEHGYFMALESSKFIQTDRIQPYIVPSRDGKSAPQHLVNNAERAIAEYGPLMPQDELWLVFEVDKHSGSNRIEQIHSALHIAESQGWIVALSNPCFEVWLLLHLADDLLGIDDYGETAENKLRDLLSGYSKSTVPKPCLDRQAIQLAITRAKARDTDPNSPIPELPGTRVYRLVERLVGTRVV